MSKPIPHTVRFVESRGVTTSVFDRCESFAAAERSAREMFGGCVRGEGFVEVYRTDDERAIPVLTLRA